MVKRGEQNRAEGRGSGRERMETLGYANQNGKASSAARAARQAPDALGEACLGTVALMWSHVEVVLTVLVTGLRRSGWPYFLKASYAPHLRKTVLTVNPDVETLDWRAVCGKTARTVRRAGRAAALSDPYQKVVDSSQNQNPGLPLSRE
jgi:hypothetical protein